MRATAAVLLWMGFAHILAYRLRFERFLGNGWSLRPASGASLGCGDLYGNDYYNKNVFVTVVISPY